MSVRVALRLTAQFGPSAGVIVKYLLELGTDPSKPGPLELRTPAAQIRQVWYRLPLLQCIFVVERFTGLTLIRPLDCYIGSGRSCRHRHTDRPFLYESHVSCFHAVRYTGKLVAAESMKTLIYLLRRSCPLLIPPDVAVCARRAKAQLPSMN
jgi:hypothetical protein